MARVLTASFLQEQLEAPAVPAMTVGVLFDLSSDGDKVLNASLISYFEKYIGLLSYLAKDTVQQMVVMFETNRLLVERQVKSAVYTQLRANVE
mmetsp:Transcript_8506/g.22717  ORF Transcript_8506/g.22717 Transcript_8506/m.22717 type:complete len:93 (-) Transcript_8506:147-425(-)